MSQNLPLRSFEIEGFRAIRQLALPELGRVNLVVGLNNAGKTSLLEAIHLYLHRHTRLVAPLLYEIIRNHTDYRSRFSFLNRRQPDFNSADIEAAVEAVAALFNGSFEGRSLDRIRFFEAGNENDMLTLRASSGYVASGFEGESIESMFFAPDSPLLVIESDSATSPVPLEWFLRRYPLTRTNRRAASVLIPATGFDPIRVRDMWDKVAVTGNEALVDSAVRIIVPELDRILLVGESGRRTVLARLHSATRPIPLQSMGDGVVRVFGIALALVHARGGVVLVDEVENGLHFSVQDQVWSAIFELARELDVQVVATTHSWDAITSFQNAATQSQEEGLLYRLEREPGGRIEAIRYTEREVEIAADQQIEVR